MPTLNWIGKEKVGNHYLDVPFHTLEKKYAFASEGQDDGGNMIIHGDNLDALKALLPKTLEKFSIPLKPFTMPALVILLKAM